MQSTAAERIARLRSLSPDALLRDMQEAGRKAAAREDRAAQRRSKSPRQQEWARLMADAQKAAGQ